MAIPVAPFLATAEGAGMLTYSSDTEQGFAVRYWSNTKRYIEDFEGLVLVRTPR